MTTESSDWRDYLTPDERDTLDQADVAKLHWQTLNGTRAGIVNRAIQRMRYALGRRTNEPRNKS